MTSTPRRCSSRCANAARAALSSGKSRSSGWTNTVRISEGAMPGKRRALARTRSLSAAIVSTPEKPPPPTTKVSSARRRSASRSSSARSKSASARIRSGGRHEKRRRQPGPVGMHRIGQEREDMPLLLTTGRAHRQDALHEATPSRAVGTVAALPPEHGGAQRAFGGVVRRLHPVYVHKRPQRWPHPEQVTTEAPRLFPRQLVPPTLHHRAQLCLDRRHRLLQPHPIQLPLPEAVPVLEQQGDLRHALLAPRAHGSGPFLVELPIPFPMSPAPP